MPYFIRRAQNRLHPHSLIMTTSIATLTIQVQELQDTFLKNLELINDAISQIQTAQQQQVLTAQQNVELAHFSSWLTVEITPYFGSKEAKMIVDRLNKCRQIHDYRFITPLYKMTGEDLKKRSLLKLTRAVHQYKFGGYKSVEKYALKSEIKYAKACPECGELAGKLYDRLVAEGLWS